MNHIVDAVSISLSKRSIVLGKNRTSWFLHEYRCTYGKARDARSDHTGRCAVASVGSSTNSRQTVATNFRHVRLMRRVRCQCMRMILPEEFCPKSLYRTSSLCNLRVLFVSCMLRHVNIDRVFCRSGRSLLAISRGCNRPIVSWCHEPVAERWSLHPFSINPNSCLAPQSPNSARPGKEN